MENLETKSYPSIAQSIGITGMMIMGALIFSPLFMILPKYIGQEASMFAYYIMAMGIPTLIAYMIKNKKTDKKSFNLAIDNHKKILPFIMVVSIALLFVASPISTLIPMPDSIKKDFMTMAYDTGIFSFLLIVIAAPIIEEMVFRGIILDGLLSRYSPFKSILLSSILFGIVHLNPWQFVIALIIGAFSGWIFYKTKNLTLSIIIHATVNLSGYIMRFFVNESSFDESLVESYGGLIGLLGTILLCIFVTVICIFFLRKEFIKQETIQSLNRENENHIL